jgi:hypothetical protein
MNAQSIEIRPTWKGNMEILIAALEAGTPAGKEMARLELRKLASNLDAKLEAELEAAAEELEALASSPAAPDPFAPGAILYASWGYEQTNVDFYRVVSRSSDFLALEKIKSQETSDDTPDRPATMTGKVVPADPIEAIGPVIRRKLHRAGTVDPWVKIDGYTFAYAWDGTPKRVSHYG